MPPTDDLWPPLPYEEWRPTKQTLHRYTQIAGKIRMSLVPFRNHWWHVTLYVTARGLSTGPMPAATVEVEIAFDLVRAPAGRHDVATGACGSAPSRTGPRWRTSTTTCSRSSATSAWRSRSSTSPSTSATAPPSRTTGRTAPTTPTRCTASGASSPRRSACSTASAASSPARRARCTSSGTRFDLAHARFSGRPAPVGDVDPVTAEAYSHEVIAFGFWPGDDRRSPYPAFYSYTAPEPDGLPRAPAGGGRRVAGHR